MDHFKRKTLNSNAADQKKINKIKKKKNKHMKQNIN